MLNKRGKIAISQIIILVIGIVAIGYAIGSEIKIISGEKIIPDQGAEAYREFWKENLQATGTPTGSSTFSRWAQIKDAPKGEPGFFSWQTGGAADAVSPGPA